MEVEGLKELGAALRAFPDKVIKNGLRSATFAGAKVVAAEVERRAPRDSGDYATAITAKRSRGTRDVVVAGVALTTRYARRIWHLLEFGTIDTAARPHLRPGLDGSAPEAMKAIADNLRKVIARETKKLARR